MLLSESGAADATHTIVMPCANPAIGPITDSSAQPEITMAELHEALARKKIINNIKVQEHK